MQSWDIQVWLLAAGVIALFAFFFWHVIRAYLDAGRWFARRLDSGSARRRAALEREIRFGKEPFWRRALRFAAAALAIGLMAYLYWNKLRAR